MQKDVPKETLHTLMERGLGLVQLIDLQKWCLVTNVMQKDVPKDLHSLMGKGLKLVQNTDWKTWLAEIFLAGLQRTFQRSENKPREQEENPQRKQH